MSTKALIAATEAIQRQTESDEVAERVEELVPHVKEAIANPLDAIPEDLRAEACSRPVAYPPYQLQPKPRVLNERQKRFVVEYVKCGVGRQAAIAAGYGEKNAAVQANHFLSDPFIRDIVHKLLNEKRSTDVATIHQLQQLWTKYAMGEIALTGHDSRLKASEMLCRSLGGFEEKGNGNKRGAGGLNSTVPIINIQVIKK